MRQTLIGDLRAADVQVFQLLERREMLQPFVGDVALIEVKPLEIGQSFQIDQSIVIDSALPKIQLLETGEALDVPQAFIADVAGFSKVENLEILHVLQIRKGETSNGKRLPQFERLQLLQAT